MKACLVGLGWQLYVLRISSQPKYNCCLAPRERRREREHMQYETMAYTLTKRGEREREIMYHGQAAYDGAEQEHHVVVDLISPLQQDVEELHEAKGSQQEAQHLDMGTQDRWENTMSIIGLIQLYMIIGRNGGFHILCQTCEV